MAADWCIRGSWMLSAWIRNLPVTESVRGLSRSGYSTVSSTASSVIERINRPARSFEIISVGIVLIALQILDGLLTGVGVSQLGTHREANPLIRTLMESWGHVPALVFVKSLAIVIVCVLCRLAYKVGWVTTALRGVVVLYLVTAIVPWIAVLLFHAT